MTNRDGEVDFSTYSSDELREAHEGIRPERYPVNYRNLLQEMAVRGIRADDSPNDSPQASGVVREGLAAVILASMMGILVYGTDRFPDNPIQPCGVNQYCGKQGQAHTADDYQAYRRWTTTMWVTWPLGMLALAALSSRRKRSRRPA